MSCAVAFESVGPCRPRSVACPFTEVGSEYRDNDGLPLHKANRKSAIHHCSRHSGKHELQFEPGFIGHARDAESNCAGCLTNLLRESGQPLCSRKQSALAFTSQTIQHGICSIPSRSLPLLVAECRKSCVAGAWIGSFYL